MSIETTYYEYEDNEQARMARDILNELMKEYGSILKQKNYYKHLEYYYEQLNKDVGVEEMYYE
ncbi:MAG: hypothetical protein NTY74_14190 [Ignavibacteriae bacterium]|nr:hypothetical protein [Ignavibacteriota bacterium]